MVGVVVCAVAGVVLDCELPMHPATRTTNSRANIGNTFFMQFT